VIGSAAIVGAAATLPLLLFILGSASFSTLLDASKRGRRRR
jgi:hypothetical protein